MLVRIAETAHPVMHLADSADASGRAVGYVVAFLFITFVVIGKFRRR